MSIASRLREWIAARKERRIEKLTARAADLGADQEYDILFLQDRGFLRARATGQSITRIFGEVESLIRKNLRVVISPGTYFVARGNYQNMVTRERHSFALYPCSTKSVTIDATCINAGLPIPTETARFYGVKRVSDDLRRFLEAARSADSMTVQVGVWALTDGYSGSDVQNHLVARDQHGNTRQAVSQANIADAKRILDQLGIHNRL